MDSGSLVQREEVWPPAEDEIDLGSGEVLVTPDGRRRLIVLNPVQSWRLRCACLATLVLVLCTALAVGIYFAARHTSIAAAKERSQGKNSTTRQSSSLYSTTAMTSKTTYSTRDTTYSKTQQQTTQPTTAASGPEASCSKNFSSITADLVGFWPLTAEYAFRDVTAQAHDFANTEGYENGISSAIGINNETDGAFFFPGGEKDYLEANARPYPSSLDTKWNITMAAYVREVTKPGPIFDFSGKWGWAVHMWIVKENAQIMLFGRVFARKQNVGGQRIAHAMPNDTDWHWVAYAYVHDTHMQTLYIDNKEVRRNNAGNFPEGIQTDVSVVTVGKKRRDERVLKGFVTCVMVFKKPLQPAELKEAQCLCNSTRANSVDDSYAGKTVKPALPTRAPVPEGLLAFWPFCKAYGTQEYTMPELDATVKQGTTLVYYKTKPYEGYQLSPLAWPSCPKMSSEQWGPSKRTLMIDRDLTLAIYVRDIFKAGRIFGYGKVVSSMSNQDPVSLSVEQNQTSNHLALKSTVFLEHQYEIGQTYKLYYDLNTTLHTTGWIWLAYTYEFSSGLQQLFVDGKSVQNSTDIPAETQIGASSTDIFFGGSDKLPTEKECFGGTITCAMIFSKALTVEELEQARRMCLKVQE